MSPAPDRILEGKAANKGNDKFTSNVLHDSIEGANDEARTTPRPKCQSRET